MTPCHDAPNKSLHSQPRADGDNNTRGGCGGGDTRAGCCCCCRDTSSSPAVCCSDGEPSAAGVCGTGATTTPVGISEDRCAGAEGTVGAVTNPTSQVNSFEILPNPDPSKKTLDTTECIERCCTSVQDSEVSRNSDRFKPTKCSAAASGLSGMLAKGKCVCRCLLRRLNGSCCSRSLRSVPQAQRTPPTASKMPKCSDRTPTDDEPSCGDGCCGPPTASTVPKYSKRMPADDGLHCGDGCCEPVQSRSNVERDSPCCDAGPQTACNEGGTSNSEVETALAKPELKDVEKDASREHITLNVTGLTCTGCSTKMTNVLAQIPGISKPEVTFVSGQASFQLDTRVASLDRILPLVEKRTGFKCSRVIAGYQHLDVYMTSEVAGRLERDNAEGLVALTRSKKTWRITYNPHVVGARDLLPPHVALAPDSDNESLSGEWLHLTRMTWFTCIAAVFTIPVVVLNWSPNSVPRQTRDVISLVLATIVQAVAVPEFYIKALKSLFFARVVEMDMLVVISITAAYGYSVVAFALTEAGVQLEQHAFFETSTLLITLVLLGRLVAAFARVRAVRAVSVRSLQTKETSLLRPDGEVTPVDARLLQFGDIIVVRPHSSIVTDGVVVFGTSAVDESMMTGETVPVRKERGDVVIAGTLNNEGVLHVRIQRLPGANSIDDIAKSVGTALGAKPKIQDLADRVASWFVPVVVATAIIVFAIWIGVALDIRGNTTGGAIGTAITYAIAVLAVSCPCALGLAVPMVLVIAGGVAARSGVVIKAADAIERGYKVTDVVFDKTGTLTTGTLNVAKEEFLGSNLSAEDSLSVVKAVVKDDSHPVSRAVAAHLGEGIRIAPNVEEIRSVPGQGIQARWGNSVVKVGNPFWLGIEEIEVVKSLFSQAMTCLCLSVDGLPVLALGLESNIRTEAAAVISALHNRDITCHVVSGDHAKAVDALALTLDVDSAHTASRHSPVQKQEYVKALQDAGKIVLFCGDGTNDAVALAQANVGIQLGTASDVAGAVADVVLLGGLDGLLTLLDTSKRAFTRIVFNFIWSAVYNVFAILLAGGAFVKVRIPPAYAGLGEIVSIAPVILAALTLLKRRKT